MTQCCWGGCGNSCEPDPNAYCSSKDTCEGSCGGQWCGEPAPTPAPTTLAPTPPTPAPTPAPTAPAGTPVARHGMLFAQGNRIIDQSGQPVQLRGMSLAWSQWFGEYWNADVVSWLSSDFKVDLVRAAMGVESDDGYLINPEQEKAKMKAVVNASIAAGIYVLVDWHAHYAEWIPQAKAFFDEMAREYGHFPNVLWETFNEPLQQDWSSVIKPYHEQLVPIIRAHSQNLISLGTRNWSQDVDEACGDPVSGSNLAYSIHFLAQVYKQAELMQRVQNAIDSGCAVFSTEWLTGWETLDLDSAQQWVDFFASRQISNVNWGAFPRRQSKGGGAFTLSASASGGWTDSQLTPSGRWVRNYLRGGNECERQASEDACSQYKPTDSYCSCSWGVDFCTMACA